MEASANFEQTAHPSKNLGISRRRFCNTRQNFQQRRFAGPIAADQANYFPSPDFEGSFPKRPDVRAISVGVIAVAMIAVAMIAVGRRSFGPRKQAHWRRRRSC